MFVKISETLTVNAECIESIAFNAAEKTIHIVYRNRPFTEATHVTETSAEHYKDILFQLGRE